MHDVQKNILVWDSMRTNTPKLAAEAMLEQLQCDMWLTEKSTALVRSFVCSSIHWRTRYLLSLAQHRKIDFQAWTWGPPASCSLAQDCASQAQRGSGVHTIKMLVYSRRLVGRVGAGDDLHELLRDLRLAGAVHLLLQFALQFLGVVRRGLHRRHAAGKLRRNGLLQRAQELAVEVERKDRVEELRGLLLEDHVRRELRGLRRGHLLLLDRHIAILRGQLEDLVALNLHARWQQRDKRAHHRLRGDHRDEGGVEELNAVKLAGVVGRKELIRDLLGLRRGRALAARNHLPNRRRAALEVSRSLVADQDELDLDALLLEGLDARLRVLDRRRVVRAAEAAVARDRHEADLLHRARFEERDVEALGLHALEQTAKDALEGLREGPRPQHCLLRAAYLSRCDQLHRRRDLLGVLDRANPVSQLADGCTHLRLSDARHVRRRDSSAVAAGERRCHHHLRGRRRARAGRPASKSSAS